MALNESKGLNIKVLKRLKLHYRVGYIQHLYRTFAWHHSHLEAPPKKSVKSRHSSTQTSNHLKLAPSASIRRPKRPSSPNTDQTPEPNSPSSNQSSRSLTLANTNHTLGILGLSLAFRVHDAVNRPADAQVRRWLDDKRQVARTFSEVVDL
jgi:hypothetical protein